jgi:two-component system LytT family sensor kinase
MKKPVVIFLHIGYWLLYWFLFTFLYFLSRATSQAIFDDDWAVIIGLASLTGFISFYAFYSWLVPIYLTKQRVPEFIAFGLAVSVVTGFLTTLVISITVYSIASIFPEVEGEVTLVSTFTVLALVNGLLGTIIRGFITWFAEIRVKEALVNKNLQIELSLLKAQINPHFLFNTLNNIDVLIEHDAKTASLYLNKLSDLLRFVLYETQADQISLTNELEYIRKYVELQKIRTTNPNFVDLQIIGQPGSLTIAPMIFIPYIENAFKHATNKKVNDAIRIQIAIDGEEVRFCCVNVIDKGRTTVQTHGGLGNQLLRQRLALLYPDRHKLDVQATEDEYSVDLLVQVKAHELPHR